MSDKDPFNEFSPTRFRKRWPVLGGMFEFSSDSARLLRLVDHAYAGLHRHRLSSATPSFRIRLRLTSGERLPAKAEPPQMRMQGGEGLLVGAMDAANFAVVCPALRTGLVAISREMLRFPYHARYELLEFAVFTLASRAQQLASLHAGCVGLDGAGVLLLGESGAGKSTLALQCLLQGMEFLAEDAVFVAGDTLLATGVANYLHLRADGLRFIDRPFIDRAFIDRAKVAAQVRRSPVIRRRSGVEKFEVDLRSGGYRCARRPLRIVSVVFVTSKAANGRPILTALDHDLLVKRFVASQSYAMQHPGGKRLLRKLAHVSAFELRRPRHPRDAALALQELLQGGQGAG